MSRLPWMFALLLCPAVALGQAGADPAPVEPVHTGADLIPDDATFALAVNSVSGVRDKGEKFVKEHGLKVGPNRPTTLFNQAFDYLKIRKGLDEKGAAAVVLPSLKKLKQEEIDFTVLRLLYIVVPVKNVAEMAENFDLKAADLKNGKPHPVRGGKVVLLKDKHLYVGFSADGLSLVPKGKALPSVVGPRERGALTKSDLALHFGADALGTIFRKQLDDLENTLKRKDDRDDSQSKALVDALRQLRFVVGGLSLDDGGKINVVASFNKGKDGAAATKFLTALRAGPGASDLIGLPAGRPWLAYAAKGDGTSNVAMIRALVNLLFDQGRIDAILPGKERPAFVASLERLYQELKGSRAALYPADPKGKGDLALVGVLDLGDTEKHLTEMQTMVKHLNAAAERAAKLHDRKAPVFAYEGKAEKVGGVSVNVVRVTVPDLDRKEREGLEGMFGPDWNRLRLAVEGKKVVFLVGSKTDLLTQTVANLKKGEKGLAADRVITGELARLAKERKLEVHVNLRNIALYQKGKMPEPVKGLTSVALTVETDRVQLEIVAARSEIRPFAALLGLADEE